MSFPALWQDRPTVRDQVIYFERLSSTRRRAAVSLAFSLCRSQFIHIIRLEVEGKKASRLSFVSRIVGLFLLSCTLARPVSLLVQALHIPYFASNCPRTDGLLYPGCFGPRRLGALWLRGH